MPELGGRICRQKDFFTPMYNGWCDKIKEVPRMHRKQWEFVMIAESLLQRGLLMQDKRGLGFGVGKEPLPSLFASFGCNITATDLAISDGWDTITSCKELNNRYICPQEQFDHLVEYRNVNMKNIPEDFFDKYDFIWSSCSLEHIGTLQDGIDFIRSSLKCLKPGGWAIHTTEYNITSNDHTLKYGNCVYRRRDIEKIKKILEKDGHYVEDIDFERGDMKFDNYIDIPPYKDYPHINLAIKDSDKWVNATSIIFIIHKDIRTGIIKRLENRIKLIYKNLSSKWTKSEISNKTVTSDKITTSNDKNYREYIYLGDHKALTKTIFGHKIFLDTRDISLAPHILLDGYWEMWITNVVINSIRDNMNIVEIGANIGYYSLIFASKIGKNGKLFAFEANPQIFEILFQSIEINGFLGRVELENKAVLDKQKRISFNKRKLHHGGSSIIKFSDEFLKQRRDDVEIIDIEAISLDEYFKNKNMKIDIIKIDAEGSEPYIFDGMKELVSKNPDIIIICEFDPYLISMAKRDPRKFLEDINRHGFILKYIDDKSNIIETSIDKLLDGNTYELYLKKVK